MIYQWREGFRLPGDPNEVGTHLEALRQKQEGFLTAEEILKDAHKKRSPIHPYFEWNDTDAAREYRLSQARYLMRAIVVVREEGVEAEPHRAFVVVSSEGKSDRYTSTRDALSDEDMRNQLLERARNEMLAWRRRYSELVELAEVFQAIDKIQSLS